MSACGAIRVMFESGVGKWAGGDVSWRDGTAMAYHYRYGIFFSLGMFVSTTLSRVCVYRTQPLPNHIAYYAHRAPLWIHQLETWGGISVEIFGALLIWSPFQIFRTLGAFSIVGMMIAINLTGTFGHLGVLTISQACMAVDDATWLLILPRSLLRLLTARFDVDAARIVGAFVPASTLPLVLFVFAWAVVAVPYIFVSIAPLVECFRGHSPLEIIGEFWKPAAALERKIFSHPNVTSFWLPLWYRMFERSQRYALIASRYHLANMYVKFAHMTRFRWEIVVQASDDEGDTWRDFEFAYKPSVPSARPAWMPGHFPLLGMLPHAP